MHFSIENIDYVCRLLFEATGISVCFIDKENNIMLDYYNNSTNNPLCSDKKELFKQLSSHNNTCDFPYIITTKYLENYFSISIINEDDLIGTVLAGPCISSEISNAALDLMISNQRIPFKYKNELLDYYNHIPVIYFRRFIHISLFAYYCIFNKKLDLSAVIENNNSLSNINRKIENEIEQEVSANRRNYFFHHTPVFEKYVCQFIKTGDAEGLKKHLKLSSLDGSEGILSKDDPLRNQKNHAICTVAITTRAAIEGGLSSELAFTLSDIYIRQIEELNDVKDIINLTDKMYFEFIDRVQKSKGHNCSNAIAICKNYIFKNLYEEIPLSQLAEIVGMSASYLSELFKKEVGISISEYIQKEKIEEAKKLMITTDYTLMEISTFMNFYDQSHFTRIFKKVTGTTPKQYRAKNNPVD